MQITDLSFRGVNNPTKFYDFVLQDIEKLWKPSEDHFLVIKL